MYGVNEIQSSPFLFTSVWLSYYWFNLFISFLNAAGAATPRSIMRRGVSTKDVLQIIRLLYSIWSLSYVSSLLFPLIHQTFSVSVIGLTVEYI